MYDLVYNYMKDNIPELNLEMGVNIFKERMPQDILGLMLSIDRAYEYSVHERPLVEKRVKIFVQEENTSKAGIVAEKIEELFMNKQWFESQGVRLLIREMQPSSFFNYDKNGNTIYVIKVKLSKDKA